MATNIDLYKSVTTLANKYKVGTITPDKFVLLANMAQEKVYMDKLSVLETNARVIDELLPLKITGQPGSLNGNRFELLSTVQRVTRVSMVLTKNFKDYSPRLTYLPDNRKTEVLYGAYSKPSARRCYYSFYYLDSKKYIVIHIPTGYSVIVTYNYYKTADAITANISNGDIVSQNLVWSKSVIDEIARETVVMYLESIGDPRYQTMKTEQLSNNNKQ